MTVNGANLLQYIPKDSGSDNSASADYLQFAQQTWSAGGVFVDAEASDEQKVQAVSTTITSLLSLFGKNEAGAAEQEVQANEKAADSLDKSIKATTEKTNTKVNELVSKMQELGAQIQQNIEKANENQEEKEKHQKELQEYLQTIDTCKSILENPDSTSAERTVVIEKLKAAGKGIAELSDAIKKLQSDINDEQKDVEVLNENQAELKTDADTAIQDGNTELNNAAAKVKAEQTKNTATATKGASDEAISIAAGIAEQSVRTAGEASSAIPVFGTLSSTSAEITAQKLGSVKDDHNRAGTQTRIPGAAKTQARISSSELTRQSSLTQFADLASYALGYSDENAAFSETFYSFLEPIGEWLENAENMDSQSEKLNSATQTASEKVEEQKEKEENNNNNNEGSQLVQTQNNSEIKFEFETDDLQELSA